MLEAVKLSTDPDINIYLTRIYHVAFEGRTASDPLDIYFPI